MRAYRKNASTVHLLPMVISDIYVEKKVFLLCTEVILLSNFNLCVEVFILWRKLFHLFKWVMKKEEIFLKRVFTNIIFSPCWLVFAVNMVKYLHNSTKVSLNKFCASVLKWWKLIYEAEKNKLHSKTWS